MVKMRGKVVCVLIRNTHLSPRAIIKSNKPEQLAHITQPRLLHLHLLVGFFSNIP